LYLLGRCPVLNDESGKNGNEDDSKRNGILLMHKKIIPVLFVYKNFFSDWREVYEEQHSVSTDFKPCLLLMVDIYQVNEYKLNQSGKAGYEKSSER